MYFVNMRNILTKRPLEKISIWRWNSNKNVFFHVL